MLIHLLEGPLSIVILKVRMEPAFHCIYKNEIEKKNVSVFSVTYWMFQQLSSASKMTDYKGLDVDGTAKTTTTSAEYRSSEKGSEPRPT